MRTLVSIITPDFTPGAVAMLASMRENSGLDPERKWVFYATGPLGVDLSRLWPGAEVRDAAELGALPITTGLAQQRHAECMRRLLLFGADTGPLVNIDCDMLCLNSLAGIDDLPHFGACRDHGINRDSRHVNTGFMVVDPSPALLVEVLAVAGAAPKLPMADQTAVNIWLKQRGYDPWQPLPDEWNTLKRVYRHRPDEWRPDTIRLLHFVGRKPWQPQPLEGEESHYLPLVELWRRYYRSGADAV